MKISGLLLASPLIISAKIVGFFGPVWQIQEIDMLTWIENRLQNFNILPKILCQQVIRQAMEPRALGLPITLQPKCFYVTPTFVLENNIYNVHGKLILNSGMTINPLDAQNLPIKQIPLLNSQLELIFLNGEDTRQLAWLKNYLPGKVVKLILTGGRLDRVAKIMPNTRLYFDQHGYLAKKLHISHVPSVAKPQGSTWRVQEFDVSKEILL